METFYIIYFFIVGTIFGSFCNVVGDRIPNGMSIIKPSSHCPKCNHKLSAIELIPIISYLIQKGKCKNCKTKISIEYPIFEMITGILFALSYIVFGLNLEIVIALTFISILIIVMISDYHYMVIPDIVMLYGIVLIIIEQYIIYDLNTVINSIISGFFAYVVMWLIKLLGDTIFKKESLGGGDIKLMFFIGLCLPLPISILPIFLGTLIALPIAIITLIYKKNNMLPFGPYLSMAAIILFLLQINWSEFSDFLINLY